MKESNAKVIEQIATDVALLDEAKAMLPAMEAVVKTAATVEEIMAIIGSRFALYPQPKREPGEWDAWWRSYFTALTGLSAAVIETAMLTHVTSAEREPGDDGKPYASFMAKPFRLRELALKAPNTKLAAYERAKAAIALAEKLAKVPKAYVKDPAAMARVRSMLDTGSLARNDTPGLKGLGEKPPAKPFPDTSAKLPEGVHITPAMRAVIARRAADH